MYSRFDHLLIPFIILLAGLIMSTLVFLLELYVFKTNNTREMTTNRMPGKVSQIEVSPPSEKPNETQIGDVLRGTANLYPVVEVH